MSDLRTCDYPGCHQPATHYAQAQGANTPLKEWFGCDRHPARALPGARSAERAVPLEAERAVPLEADEPDGSFARPFYCERAECGNELTFDDIQAGDGLCSSCAEPVDVEK